MTSETQERVDAIVEDVLRRRVNPHSNYCELDSFFEEDELARFKVEVINEFELKDDSLFVEGMRFRDLFYALDSGQFFL